MIQVGNVLHQSSRFQNALAEESLQEGRGGDSHQQFQLESLIHIDSQIIRKIGVLRTKLKKNSEKKVIKRE